MISNYTYLCTGCDAQLDQESEVILDIERSNGEKAKIYLHPKPGVYMIRCQPLLEFEEDEFVNFFCPECHKNLKSLVYHNFVELKMKVSERVSFEVLFSRIYGDKKTYVVTEDFDEILKRVS